MVVRIWGSLLRPEVVRLFDNASEVKAVKSIYIAPTPPVVFITDRLVAAGRFCVFAFVFTVRLFLCLVGSVWYYKHPVWDERLGCNAALVCNACAVHFFAPNFEDVGGPIASGTFVRPSVRSSVTLF